jgi:hypothetical protein
MTDNQKLILTAMANGDGSVTAERFHALCGRRAKVINAMLRDGLIDVNGIPASIITITEKGRAELRRQKH